MAQYYHILGQPQPMTIEDLQRINICVDGSNAFIINSDETAYGPQQVILSSGDQTHGIIVGSAPDTESGTYAVGPTQYIMHDASNISAQPAAPAAAAAPATHQQVYFTGEQVVLQQGQQIIDPSLVTHQTHQIQQHHQQLVPSQQTIAHPPHSLLQLHTPGIMQQQQTLHYVDHRHQGQQIQQHQIQQQQLQQHQQQQLQQHQQQQQQLQQLQQQQLQLMQQQQQQQIQQHFPRPPFQQQTAVQQQIQHPPPRVLNHHPANSPRPPRPAGPRGVVRPPRPQNRTPNATMRNPTPGRTPARLVRPQLVNATAPNETSPIRNRTPGSVQIQTPNRINQQNRFNIQQSTAVTKRFILNSSAAGAPSDLDDLEESITAAVLSKNPNSNQHHENVKQEQFTITTNIGGQQQQQVVRQNVQQPQTQNHLIHINAQIQLNNQPQHIIQVQPQNFNHQQQAQPAQQQFTSQNQIYRQQQIALPQVNQHQNVFSGDIFVDQQGHQQVVYEQKQQVFEGASQESDEMVTLSNGQKISLTEFKKMQQNRSPRQSSPTRFVLTPSTCNGQSGDKPEIQTSQGTVQVVSPVKSNNQVILKSSDNAEPQSAKMLIMLPNGEQRLITFILPKESCTVQELLEQINVPVSADSEIQCIPNTAPELDYFVFIGSPAKLDEILENSPFLANDLSNAATETGSPGSGAISSTEISPEKNNSTPALPAPQAPPQPPASPPPRYVEGMLAVCKYCGFTGLNFNKCQRCSRKFPEEPKAVPICTTKKPEKTEVKETSSGIGLETMKLNLLKPVKGKIIHDAKNKKNRRPRAKHLDPEPVILTLSSDDEDSNSSSQNTQGSGDARLNNVIDTVIQSAFLKEPLSKELEVAPSLLNSNEDINREEILLSNAGVAAVISCRTIKIGSHKFAPKESVLITSKGMRIVAPMADDPSIETDLQLQSQEIVKVLMHPGKGVPVIFMYTDQLAAKYVCQKLRMTDTNGSYYNPVAYDELYKRITLLPYSISEENRTNMKLLFSARLEELTVKEGNDILLKTCSKEAQQSAKMITRTNSTQLTSLTLKSTSCLNNDTIRKILIYPPGKGGISINTEDYMCLAQDQFLNDVIIDFYLKYLCHETISQQQRDKTHVFSTFFYKRLTTKPNKPNRSDGHEWDMSLTPAQKRHLRVKSWTKNVNIFEKDFVIVPINENSHWFLAIICFPGLEGCRSMRDDRLMSPQEMKKKAHEKRILQLSNNLGSMLKQEQQLALNCDSDNLSEKDEAEAEESDMDLLGSESDEEEAKPINTIETNTIGMIEPIKQPCILIFDSLAGASRSRVVATLRDYLTHEYAAKMKVERMFTRDNIKGACPKIPQQSNYTDCGLYLLQFAEHFFKDPVLDYRLPIKQLVNWFEEIVVTRKREEISNLLKKLMLNSNNDINILPDIVFPTLNGKLLDMENGEGETQSGDSTLEHEAEMESPRRTVSIVTVNNIVNKLNVSDNNDSASARKTSRMENVHIPIKYTEKIVHISENFVNKTINKRKIENSSVSSSDSSLVSSSGGEISNKKRAKK